MKKKNIFLIIITLLLGIVIVYESNSLIKTLNKKPNILEDIKVIDLKKDQSIAIMVQDTEGDGWHEQEDRSKWPSPTTHGFVGAKCTDSEGAEIDYTEILQFNLSNYTAEINTKNSVYCTLYFAKGRPLLQALTETKGTTLDMSNAVDGMYRYKGTATEVTNNYICFGTTDKAECLKAPETYMYRIMGITSTKDDTINIPANSLKIIKATPSSESQAWHSLSRQEDCETYGEENGKCKWDASYMKGYLNGTFYNSIKDAKPNGAYWDSLILSHKWYIKDRVSYEATEEPKDSQNISTASKIGLMYAADYKNSGGQNTNNWLFIKNGWSTNSTFNNPYEWTMSRYGPGSSSYMAWEIFANGDLFYQEILSNPRMVRPVFYLQSEVNLIGEGNKENPFIISGVMPQS